MRVPRVRLTVRRVMILVAVLAAVLGADGLRRRRDELRFRAWQYRVRSDRAREDHNRAEESLRVNLSGFRRNIASWMEQAEKGGDLADVARCRALLAATDRVIEVGRGTSYPEANLETYRDEVTKWTEGARVDLSHRRSYTLGDQLGPDNFAALKGLVDHFSTQPAKWSRLLDYYERLAEKYERASRHPCWSVEPDPPMPW